MVDNNEIIDVIDAHTHVFPDKIADKSKSYVGSFYNLPMYTSGTEAELKKISSSPCTIKGRKYQITKQLICSPAVSEAQTESINNYIAMLTREHSELIGFGTLHPDNENYTGIIDEIVSLGLSGIKFHSDFQKFKIDNEKMLPIYLYIADKNLPVLFHMGDKKLDYSSPERLAAVIGKVPKLRVIAAHMGGYTEWNRAYNLPVSKNLFFDISSSIRFISKEEFFRFLDKFGCSHFFFGSDFPMWNPYNELKKLLDFDLDEKLIKMLVHDNFVNFMN